MRGGKRKKLPGLPAGEFLKKGALPPCILRAWNLSVLGFRQSIYEPAGNFYTFDNGEKGRRTQKSGASGLKNQEEAPLVGFRCGFCLVHPR